MATTTLTPLLKQKVDELFLHWFSEVETQQQLRQDLVNIRGGAIDASHLSPRPSSPAGLSSVGLNINTRPSSPPIPPGSPTSTPRSPRRRTSSTLSRRSSRKSLCQSLHEEKRGQLYPGCAKNLKPFYFPYGEPSLVNKNIDDKVSTIKSIFNNLPNNTASLDDFEIIAKTCGYPLYWKYPLFTACGGIKNGSVTYKKFITNWQRINSMYHDNASQFFHMLLKDGKRFLESDDFEGLLQDVINTHPGLQFLVEAPEFHSRYIITVISRIFYCLNRSWNGRITLPELRRSNFLEVLGRLEEEEDINQIVDYFSYEHFYVIYCKFWELDTDHDMIINKQDLSRYLNGAISGCMVDRLFSGCVTRGNSFSESTMSYIDFVWFILSEVDKTSPTGTEYWFRCMDLDGNGIITMYEMQYFYHEQIKKMEELGMETLAFEDCLCQILDLVKPITPNMVTLRDIKNCRLASVFFDTFFNLDRWIEHEQKDPFQVARDENDQEISAWDRYVVEEYELLVAEEGGMQVVEYDNDLETDDDITGEDIFKTISSPFDNLGPRWSVVSAVNDSSDIADDDETFY